MRRLHMESTLLASAAYSPDECLLELEFRDGTVYHFFEVPAACFQQLMASDSKGAFFNRNIRNQFPYQLLTALDPQN